MRPGGPEVPRQASDTLSNKLRTKVTKGKDKVTDAQIADVLQQEQDALRPARARDLDRPDQDEGQGRRGQGRARGRPVVQDGRQEVLDRPGLQEPGRQAARRRQGPAGEGARRRRLQGEEGRSSSGPVKTQFGYYVFEVAKITPASQQTLSRPRRRSSSCSQSQNQQKTLDEFVKDFQKKWKDRTNVPQGLRDAGLQERAEGAASSAAPPSSAAPSSGKATTVSGSTSGGTTTNK